MQKGSDLDEIWGLFCPSREAEMNNPKISEENVSTSHDPQNKTPRRKCTRADSAARSTQMPGCAWRALAPLKLRKDEAGD